MKKFTFLYIVLGTLLLLSCSKNEQDSSFKGKPKVFFTPGNTSDSIVYSFANFPAANYKDLPIKLQIMGDTSYRERVVNISVVQEETTALPAEYELPSKIVIPAGEVTSEMIIKLKNTSRLENTQVKLVLKIVPSTDFTVDNMEENSLDELVKYKIYWANILLRPDDWPSEWGGYSKTKHRLVIDLTGYSIYSGTQWSAESLTYTVMGICNEWLDNYNESHPGSPYRDETGKIIRFSPTGN